MRVSCKLLHLIGYIYIYKYIKMVCPMRGECRPDKIIFKATVTREDTGQAETYTGLTAGSFKQRWRTHNSSLVGVIGSQ